MIFVTSAAERIASTTHATFQQADDRPDGWDHAVAADHVLVNPHLALESRSFRFNGCQRRGIIDGVGRSALSAWLVGLS
jgi:hypothetical protein